MEGSGANISGKAEAAEKAKELRKHDRERLHRAVAETFATEAGRITLRWLKDICGYQKFGVTVDPRSQEINKESTLYNEFRRSVYLNIRSKVNRDTLIAVEINTDDSDDLI